MNRIEQLEKQLQDIQKELGELKQKKPKLLKGEIVFDDANDFILKLQCSRDDNRFRKLNGEERMLICKPDDVLYGCIQPDGVIMFSYIKPLIHSNSRYSKNGWLCKEFNHWATSSDGHQFRVPAGELDCSWQDTLVCFKELEV